MDYALSRHNMIEGQIKTNRVNDPYVIDAMAQVPREKFVPTTKRGVAYVDDAIDLENGRCLLEPLILARMLDAAGMSESDIVLDIGCTTGYSTAVLAKIANTVVALESDAELAESASAKLNKLGIDNAVVVQGDLSEGVPKQAPFDVIIVNGAVTEIPDTLKNQLADGGRLLAIATGKASLGTLSVTTRNGDIFSTRDVMEAGASVLPGFEKKQAFVF